jgi:histidinol-phosphatase (PHP family)
MSYNQLSMWANFHSHNKYCDGKGELSDYLESAKKNNVVVLGFSSHAPLPFDSKWAMNKENLPLYLKEISKLQSEASGIDIYKSLEIDFIPGVISPFDHKEELDYLIGSIHFIDQFADGRHWEIDGQHSLFLEGLEQIFNNNFRDAIVRYFELTREMVYSSAPDIIGHLDKIKIQNVQGKFFNESDSWYKEEVLRTLKLIDQAELIVEVNTRGIYQKKSNETYPSKWILEIIRQKDIPITLSSDAHHPDDLINTFPQTAKQLHDLGFTHLSVFRDGRWKKTPFNENGLVF